MDVHEENAGVARHGWAALLQLLVAKGLISPEESMQVVAQAHRGVSMFEAFGLTNTAEVRPPA